MDDYSGNYSDPQSLHKYLYCHANPINATDPSGKFIMSTTVVATLANLSLVIADITRCLVVGSIIYTRMSLEIFLWQLNFGSHHFFSYIYDLANRPKSIPVRMPDQFWARYVEALANSQEFVTKVEAETWGFENHQQLVNAWKRVFALNDDMEIHHFVQQHDYNIDKFNSEAIYSIANTVPIPHNLHILITKYTNSSTKTLNIADK